MKTIAAAKTLPVIPAAPVAPIERVPLLDLRAQWNVIRDEARLVFDQIGDNQFSGQC